MRRSASEEATGVLAASLAAVALPGLVIALSGDLGAGKSVFARAMIRALGVQDAYIASPTFTILNRYEDGRLPVSHFDWYRLNHPEELAEIGADEELDGQRLVLVEWPEHAAPWLPPDHLRIRIEHGDDGDEREILLEAAAGLGCVVLGQWLARNDLDRELFREEP